MDYLLCESQRKQKAAHCRRLLVQQHYTDRRGENCFLLPLRVASSGGTSSTALHTLTFCGKDKGHER